MKKRILCFGDSNTWGYTGGTGERYGEDVRWPCRLAALTGHTVIEEGLNGRTSVFDDALWPGCNGLKYLEPCLKSHAPLDMVIISVGTNDLKVNNCGTAGGAAQGAGMLVQKTRQVLGDKIPILLISPVFIGYGRKNDGPMWVLRDDCYEQSRMFPYFYKLVAEQCGCELLDAQQVAEPGAADSMHMDEKGHAALAEAVAKKVREILG